MLRRDGRRHNRKRVVETNHKQRQHNQLKPNQTKPNRDSETQNSDHWSTPAHRDERRFLIEHLQMLAKIKGLRVSLISGDVHLATTGERAGGGVKRRGGEMEKRASAAARTAACAPTCALKTNSRRANASTHYSTHPSRPPNPTQPNLNPIPIPIPTLSYTPRPPLHVPQAAEPRARLPLHAADRVLRDRQRAAARRLGVGAAPARPRRLHQRQDAQQDVQAVRPRRPPPPAQPPQLVRGLGARRRRRRARRPRAGAARPGARAGRARLLAARRDV